MRNLLIVDDEKNIRLGLKAMIDREFPDAYTITFASDGLEALRIIRHLPVDIVITDIRMPGMDGIQLINALQEEEHKPAVLLLSGYNDFQYAQEAIRCEVRDYLLKPIVREDLFESLRRVERDLSRSDDISAQLQASVRQREEYERSQLGYILLRPSMAPEEMRDMLAAAGMQWVDGGFRLGLLKFFGRAPSLGKKEIPAAADALFSGMPDEYRSKLVRAFDKEDRAAVLSADEAVFDWLAEKLKDPHHTAYSLGLSAHAAGMDNLRKAYQEAEQALKYTLLEPNPVVWFEHIRGGRTDYEVPADSIKRIGNMLGTGREQEMKRLFYEVMDMTTVSQYDIGYLESVSRALNEHVFDKVFHVYGEESVIILQLYKKAGDIYQFRRYHDYVRTLESLLDRLNEYIATMKSVHVDHKEMKAAVDYIRANYQKDLNMATVSNYVSLSYSYFSQAFKEYTGMSFVQFVKTVRIEKAKELLETTDRKVVDIALMAGFENAKHFNRVFKEMEGVTPLEYRMQKSVLS